MTMQAEHLHCQRPHCDLIGQVELTCGPTWIRAHRAQLRLNQWQQLEWAKLSGQVMIWSEEQVISADEFEIEAAHQHLRLHNGLMTFHVPGATPSPIERAYGTVRAQMASRNLYSEQQLLHACDNQFSVCHCPADQDVPWLIKSPHITIQPGYRALIWWPMVYMRIANSPLFPITPPLMPLSLPLQSRAIGLLPPVLQWYSASWRPSIRLPVFFPLGPSFDITLSPGLRMDWYPDRHHAKAKVGLLQAGAPQLYARIRYAPWQDVRGIFRFRYVYDGGLASVWQQRKLRPEIAPLWQQQGDLPGAVEQALTHRLFWQWRHQSHWGKHWDQLLHLQYFSDTRIPEDFLFNAMIRLASYQPSRAQIYGHFHQATVLLKADLWTRIDSDIALLNQPERLPTTFGIQPNVLQRLPSLQIELLPWHLADAWSLQAQGSWHLISSFVRSPSPQIHTALLPLMPQGPLWLGHGRTTLAWQRPLGLFANHLSLSYDGLTTYQPHRQQWAIAHGILQEGMVQMPLSGRWAGWQHTLEPMWQWRLFWHMPQGESAWPPIVPQGAIDPWLLRQSSWQTALVVRQQFTSLVIDGLQLTLELGQPFRFRPNQWLQHWGEARLSGGPLYMSVFWAAQWPGRGIRKDLPEWSSEIGGRWQRFHLVLRYVRIGANVDRFFRSPYAITAIRSWPEAYDQPLRQHHSSLSMGIPLHADWSIALMTGFNFRKAQKGTFQPWWSCQDGDQSPRLCWNQHFIQLEYKSPCNCFGWIAQGFIDGEQLRKGKAFNRAVRFNLSFSLQP